MREDIVLFQALDCERNVLKPLKNSISLKKFIISKSNITGLFISNTKEIFNFAVKKQK